jgi:hypothetical protein
MIFSFLLSNQSKRNKMKNYEIEINEEIMNQIMDKDYIGILNLEYIHPEDEMIFMKSFEGKIIYMNDLFMDLFELDKSKYDFIESDNDYPIDPINSDFYFEMIVGISKDDSMNRED